MNCKQSARSSFRWARTGLVVFAGDAFTVSPLTRDADTIRAQLRALHPSIMPSQGSRADLGLEQALELQKIIGFPTIIRPSFTMGGSGGGIAYNREEFEEICARGLDLSPTSELLIEESILGWKEYEMEVVRDKHDRTGILIKRFQQRFNRDEIEMIGRLIENEQVRSFQQ